MRRWMAASCSEDHADEQPDHRHRSSAHQGRQGCTHNSRRHHHTEGSAGKQSIDLYRMLTAQHTESPNKAVAFLFHTEQHSWLLKQHARLGPWEEHSSFKRSALMALQQADGGPEKRLTCKLPCRRSRRSLGARCWTVCCTTAPRMSAATGRARPTAALVLESLRLATDVLAPRGSFVTKIFR